MVKLIPGSQNVESETDLMLVNKLNEVISEVNNIEAKLQSASPTNIDYTAALEKELDALWDSGRVELIGTNAHEMAAHLNYVLQNCA